MNHIEKIKIIENWSLKFDVGRDSNGWWYASVFTFRSNIDGYFTPSFAREADAITSALAMARNNVMKTVLKIESEK